MVRRTIYRAGGDYPAAINGVGVSGPEQARKGPDPATAARDSAIRIFLDALGGRGVVALCAIANIALVAHIAGPSVYGAYAAATAFSTLLFFFTDLGSGQVVVREAALDEHQHSAVATYVHSRVILCLITT